MNWCIFYGDGSTFSNEDGSYSEAPVNGVIVIVQDWRNPCQVLHGTDFYWWRDDHWCGGDIFGFLDQSARYGATWVKQGESIYDKKEDLYSKILTRAVDLKDKWDGWRN